MTRTFRVVGVALALAGGVARAVTAQVVESRTGLVVSASAYASDVGASILHAGGNAVDAAVATGFALAVSWPAAGNLGGGGFMVIRLADGRATTIDYRERAPGRATPTMYLDASGKIDRDRATFGYLAPGVPGTVRGLALAHRKYGKLPWRKVVEPAAALARKGFALSPLLAEEFNWLVKTATGKFPATIQVYGKPGGGEWVGGDVIKLPLLAKTLDAIARGGPDAFYKGWIADRIAADMKAHGGLISKADLAAYQAVERPPVRGTFLGHEIISMGPPSSGGTAIVTMLNLLERFNIANRPRYAPMTMHLMIEAQRRAYLDRAQFLGDSDFVSVPVPELTSKDHAARLAVTIDTTRSSRSLAIASKRIPAIVNEPNETTHFGAVDGKGNAVSNTYTLEGAYGSTLVVAGAGFLLNNEMGDFNKKPGTTTTGGDIGTDANLIAPGKRMLSSMSPTIVTRDGKVVLVAGSPGGRTIINTVHQIVLNATAFKMDVRAAVDAPRIHSQWLPDEVLVERGLFADSTLARLTAMGHKIVPVGRLGFGHTIAIDPVTGVAYGANDKRDVDSKVSQ